MIGIGSEEAVPEKWNLSRFLDTLGREPHLSLLHEVFDSMIQRLGSVVPDLGRDTAGDATSLNARRKKSKGGQRALLIHEPSALSDSPACRRLYGAPTPPDHGAGWALYSAFPLREVAPSFCTATYTPAASPSD